MASCVGFHSEWMARAPDKIVAEEASTRRERFPVAAVVVVHDDIALMRTTLEEVATVVEHIVSAGAILHQKIGQSIIDSPLPRFRHLREDGCLICTGIVYSSSCSSGGRRTCCMIFSARSLGCTCTMQVLLNT